MATRKPNDDASLPFAALQLLSPPLRLVSAAIWKVMKTRDIMQYGVVEEFVTSACETVPGLLTVRHQGKLALGLRARLILELCSTQPDVKVVEHHLKRICAPASSSSAPTVRKDVKVLKTAENFHRLVHTLLTDPAGREQFFKEKFPVEYGPTFDKELEKLMWEFLIRLDQLLPVPSLAQTVSWLSGAPPVLEECAQAATQPQLLKILLQHQTCLGHLEPAASLPPNMGDSILDSLSLPLSGRVPSDQPTETKRSAVEQPGGAQRRDNTPFITPVIGLISNEDVPVMNSTSRRTVSSKDATNDSNENLRFTVVNQKQQSKDDEGQEAEEELQEETKTSKRSIRKKRKHPDQRPSESDEEELLDMTRSGKKRISRVRQGRGGQRTDKKKEEGAKTVRNEECNTAVLSTCMTKLGVGALHLPEDPSLSSIYASCLSSQPRVIIEKLSVASVSADRPGRRGKYSHEEQQSKRRNSPIKTVAHKSRNSHGQKRDSDLPGLDDKETYQ
ncbi:TERF1-interacting nuclear factor 2 isoform X2 [Anabas testudineus]|uniref:TERF1-interacting nuclear factor 2 isoform X2 n=1 Tax=Anabas testudineus TaxID=64144 RepID=UPI000E4573F2|nr:TERF1-interacting nuclear factor 2 isoform X2 [Anabas testudineus]